MFPNLYAIVNKFRLCRREKAARGKIPNLAFATFKGQPDDRGSTAAQSSDIQREGIYKGKNGRKCTCICGREHRWSECYYVNETVRLTGWKPNPEIQKKFAEKLEDEPFFKTR
jgi:hypothetical protein